MNKNTRHQVRLTIDADSYAIWRVVAEQLGTAPGALLRKIAESPLTAVEAAEMYSAATIKRAGAVADARI